MPNEREDDGQQAVDPLGDRLRMSEARFQKTREMGTSTNSSSPTEKVSEFPRTNGSMSEPTHIAAVVNLASWLSSPEAEQFFTSPLPAEANIEFQLQVNIATFGRESHMHKTTAAMLRQMHVNGLHVDSAYIVINGERQDVTERYTDNHGAKWYDEKYNGAVVLTENPIDV